MASWRAAWLRRHHQRRGSRHGLWMTVVSAMIVGTDARGVAMFLVMAERHFAHALHLDTSAALA